MEHQSQLRAVLKGAKDCEENLAGCRDGVVDLLEEMPWYKSNWMWLSVGLVLGFGTAAGITAAILK